MIFQTNRKNLAKAPFFTLFLFLIVQFNFSSLKIGVLDFYF